MLLGIVLLNYKNYTETIDCVLQIKEQNLQDAKIYIVDNASPNESYTELTKKFDGDESIEVILSDKNGGFSYGNNIGFKKAVTDGCKYILCSNCDVKFFDGSINNLVSALENNADVAVVGPKIYTAEGKIQKCNRTGLTKTRFVMHHKPFCYFDIFGINRRYTMAKYNFEKNVKFKGMVSGCCFMVRADVISALNYLDDNIFLYHEEDVLAEKLVNAGWYTMIDVSSEIIHYGSGSIGGVSAFTRYCSFTGAFYFLRTYKRISRFSLKKLYIWVALMFRLKASKNNEYKKYIKDLKADVKKLAAKKK